MSKTLEQNLSGVPETLLVTLYLRAMESQRPDALIKDEKAVALVNQMSYDFIKIKQMPLFGANKLVLILRSREFDRYASDFLSRHPDAVVVHVGCGLDSRFERVCAEQQYNGRVDWYDLDVPDVIDLRRKFIGGEEGRYHLLACSVFEDAWLKVVEAHKPRPFLFLAEGVFMYFEEAQVKSLVLLLREHFQGAELVFDAFSPFHIWESNLQLSTTKLNARFPRLHWGIWRGQEIERWGEGIHLLDEWGFFDEPEPRLASIQWLRRIEHLIRTHRIYYFLLGEAERYGHGD